MFTGIVETTGSILALGEGGIVIERPESFDDVRVGSSILVAGVCLSMVGFDDDSMTFDVIGETLDKTTLGEMNVGDEVNLERSLPAYGRFEGHVVQGHVEGVGTVASIGEIEGWTMLAIQLPETLMEGMVPKGSIAVDGVSLTIADIDQYLCSIALIPHTLEVTTLGSLKPQDHVNIESDIIGRYVQSMLSQQR